MTEKKQFTKLCETYEEYLCGYCIYRQPLGHCRYYKDSYRLNELKELRKELDSNE